MSVQWLSARNHCEGSTDEVVSCWMSNFTPPPWIAPQIRSTVTTQVPRSPAIYGADANTSCAYSVWLCYSCYYYYLGLQCFSMCFPICMQPGGCTLSSGSIHANSQHADKPTWTNHEMLFPPFPACICWQLLAACHLANDCNAPKQPKISAMLKLIQTNASKFLSCKLMQILLNPTLHISALYYPCTSLHRACVILHSYAPKMAEPSNLGMKGNDGKCACIYLILSDYIILHDNKSVYFINNSV